MNLLDTINISGAAVGIFITIVILGFKKSDRNVKLVLSSLLFFLSITIISTIGYDHLNISRYYLLFGPCGPSLVVFGPLVYLYVNLLTNNSYKLQKMHFLHFIPYFINLVYYVPMIYFFSNGIPGLSLFQNTFQYYLNALFIITRLPLLFLYLLYSMNILKKHRSEIKNLKPDFSNIKLSWLLIVVGAFSTMIINNIFRSYSDIFLSNTFNEYIFIYNTWQTVLLLFLGYKGLIQPDIFSSYNGNSKKYENSNLTTDKSDRYLKQLLELMESDRPYFDCTLSLNSLAERLSISPKYLSQIINEQLQQNFTDFINRYRIEEAQKQLNSEKKSYYTILGIANDVGFKTKSSFNNAFKKFTNMSPTQYLNSIRN